jgi:hypothetical protein
VTLINLTAPALGQMVPLNTAIFPSAAGNARRAEKRREMPPGMHQLVATEALFMGGPPRRC